MYKLPSPELSAFAAVEDTLHAYIELEINRSVLAARLSNAELNLPVSLANALSFLQRVLGPETPERVVGVAIARVFVSLDAATDRLSRVY